VDRQFSRAGDEQGMPAFQVSKRPTIPRGMKHPE
jgi:hypothetical protein